MPEIISGMAFSFDSPSFALLTPPLLFAACVSGWTLMKGARASCRINIRFAAMLLAALAVARALALFLPDFAALGPAVAMIAASLGTTLLALGLFAVLAHPLPPLAASLALGLALAAGLAAALSGAPAYALGCQILGVSLTMAAALGSFAVNPRRALLSLLAALSLLGGGLCLMAQTVNFALVFFAAGLIGAARASQTRIETEREAHAVLAVKTLR